jgi:hypothetical protein
MIMKEQTRLKRCILKLINVPFFKESEQFMFIKKSSVVSGIVSFSLIASLVGCGGGSGGSDLLSSISSSISAAFPGPIAGIGSIIVNGVRFEIVGVTVEDADDIYGTQTFNNSLALGMTVALAGKLTISQRLELLQKFV